MTSVGKTDGIHAYPRTKENMRLTYNFSNKGFALYPIEHEETMLFGNEGLISPNDAYSTYDISHWTQDDFRDFSGANDDNRVAMLKDLTEITDDTWGIDNGCTHNWGFIDGNSGTMKCAHCGHYQN